MFSFVNLRALCALVWEKNLAKQEIAASHKGSKNTKVHKEIISEIAF